MITENTQHVILDTITFSFCVMLLALFCGVSMQNVLVTGGVTAGGYLLLRWFK